MRHKFPGVIIIIFIIGLSFVAVLPTFAQTESKTSKSKLATIKLSISAHTWREGKDPYDIHASIKEKLKKASFEIVVDESTAYNAILFVDYTERKGWQFLSGGYGTSITCTVKLEDKMRGSIFEKQINGRTPSPAVDLYRDAIEDFENKTYFKYFGDIIATRYGMGAEALVLIKALNEMPRCKAPDTAKWPVFCPIRWETIDALGEIGDTRAVEWLIKALMDKEEVTRKHAAKALGNIGDARAIEPLIQGLKDEDKNVRKAAEEALKKIKAKKN
jgi:hypothetical protein